MSKDETEIEALIQAKGLTRPRLTPQDVDDTIKAETYTTLPSGKVMVCELTLRNGFTVRGPQDQPRERPQQGVGAGRLPAATTAVRRPGGSPGRRTGLNAAMPAPRVLAPANARVQPP